MYDPVYKLLKDINISNVITHAEWITLYIAILIMILTL